MLIESLPTSTPIPFIPSSFPPCVIGKHEIGDMSRSHRLCRWHAWRIFPHSHDSRSQKQCTACYLRSEQQHGTWTKISHDFLEYRIDKWNRVEVKPVQKPLADG